MGIGTPGGNKIPTILNEVLIDYLRGDGTLQESIDKPRFITMVVQFIMRMRQVMKISIHSRVWDMVLKKNVMTQTLVVFKVQYIIKMIKLLKSDKMLVIDNGLVNNIKNVYFIILRMTEKMCMNQPFSQT